MIDFSVLTPSYNQSQWLPANIQSVKTQASVTVEHLIADGGSNDGSLEIISNSPARLISNYDRGQTDALRKLLTVAEGTFVGWLNSDDAFVHRHVLATVAEAFRKNPQASLVYGHAMVIDAQDRVTRILHAPARAQHLIMKHNCLSQPSVFLRRRSLSSVAFNTEYNMVMDRALWLEMMFSGEWLRLDTVLSADRDHPQRKSFAGYDEMAAERRRLDATYGQRRSVAGRVLNRRHKLHSRVAGASHLRSLMRMPEPEKAFSWRTPPRVIPALARQVFLPRRLDAISLR